MATADKLTYLNTTKGKIKDSINITGANITNETTFRNYAVLLKDKLAELLVDPSPIWDNFPKTNATGTDIQVNTYASWFDYLLKGDTYQYTTTGGQLLDISSLTTTYATYTFTNDILSVECTTSGTYCRAQLDITDIYVNNQGKTIRLDFSNYTTQVSNLAGVNLQVQRGSSNTYPTLVGASGTKSGHTIPNDTSDITKVYIRFMPNNTNTNTANKITFTKPYLHFGASTTDYEPYTGNQPSPSPTYPQNIDIVSGLQEVEITNGTTTNTYDINLGKNLASDTTLKQGLWCGSSTISSNNNGWYVVEPCLPNTTYIISKKNTTGTIYVNFTSVYPINGTTTGQINQGSSGIKSLSFTTPSNANYIFIGLFAGTPSDTQKQECIEELMLEKGNQATEYSHYFTPIELCKIGTYQDYIYKEGKKWYLHKEIGKTVLNGSESDWTKGSTTQVNRYVLNNFISNYNVSNLGFNNYFIITGLATTTIGTCYINATQLVINFGTYSSSSTVNDFKTWLSTHNTIVYYVLANPTTEEITNSELISQLNSIELVDGENNITITGDLAAIMNLTVLERE